MEERGASMTMVLDASTAASWNYPDEIDDRAAGLRQRVESQGAVVPSLWPQELANSMRNGIRRGRTTRDIAYTFLGLVQSMPIEIDANVLKADAYFWLSETLKVTPYDAAYLYLAIERELPIATKDQEMIAAAEWLGIEVL